MDDFIFLAISYGRNSRDPLRVFPCSRYMDAQASKCIQIKRILQNLEVALIFRIPLGSELIFRILAFQLSEHVSLLSEYMEEIIHHLFLHFFPLIPSFIYVQC